MQRVLVDPPWRHMNKSYALVMTAAVCMTAAGMFAQSTAREQLVRGNAFWDQRLAKSAIAALDAATRDKGTAAEAHEALGRIYTFKGWQQESAFPGWHDEPGFRDRALSELEAAVAADPVTPFVHAVWRAISRYDEAPSVPAPGRYSCAEAPCRSRAVRAGRGRLPWIAVALPGTPGAANDRDRRV